MNKFEKQAYIDGYNDAVSNIDEIIEDVMNVIRRGNEEYKKNKDCETAREKLFNKITNENEKLELLYKTKHILQDKINCLEEEDA